MYFCLVSASTPTTSTDDRGRRGSGLRGLLAGKNGPLKIVLPVVAVGIAVIAVIGSQQPPAYKIADGNLTISAASGQTIPLAGITTITLRTTMPPDLVKVAGDRAGTQLRGDFESNGTSMSIYVDTAVPPFIYLGTKSGPVILNDQSATKTESLYAEIRDKVATASR